MGGNKFDCSPDVDRSFLSLVGVEQDRTATEVGTRALLLAILDDGIQSFLSPVKQIRTEAELWVGSRRHSSPFSFRVVCQSLNLEPATVRKTLQRMRAQHVQQRKLATAGRKGGPKVRSVTRAAG